jgi:hypothetical protein
MLRVTSKVRFYLIAVLTCLLLGAGAAWADEFERDQWMLPAASDQRVIHIPRSTGGDKSTTFMLKPFSRVGSPAEGVLIYKGRLSDSETAIVLSHGGGTYSVISSPFEWEQAFFIPRMGSSLTKNQFLVNARGGASVRIPVTWRLFREVDERLHGVRDLDQFIGSAEARQLGLQDHDQVLKLIFAGTEINTKRLMQLGAIQFNVTEGVFRDDFSVSLDQQELAEPDLIQNTMLLASGARQIEVTSGRFFKTTQKSTVHVSVAGTNIQAIKKSASNDIVAVQSGFIPGDAVVSLQAANSGISPAIENGRKESATQEQERLAQEAQAKESERLAQLAAANEKLRVAQEARVKEQERLAQEAKAREAERLAEIAKAKEQERIAQETTAKEQQRIAQEAQARERERLLQVARVKEQERLAEEAQAGKAAFASLLAQKAENERLKAEAAAAKARQQALEEQIRTAEAARLAAAQATPPMREVQAHALVIGNAAYGGGSKLANPANDAKAMSMKLRSLGFIVTEVLDGNRGKLVSALSQFSQKASGADISVLFYAGHGVQIGGTNYMLPVDLDLGDLNQVPLQGISLNSVVEQYLPGKTKLVFLDACRDNPLVRVASRSVTRGLAPINVSEGTLIAYATKDGQVAQDGDGMNSPFTAALLEHLSDPDDIAVVLRKVRQKVMKSTGNRQQPWEYGSLTGGSLVLSSLKPAAR